MAWSSTCAKGHPGRSQKHSAGTCTRVCGGGGGVLMRLAGADHPPSVLVY